MKNRKALYVGRPNLGDKSLLDAAIEGIYERQWLTNDGPLVRKLESRLSEYLEVKHCILVSNGTAAIELAARALQLKGEVILPSFTFIASAHALEWLGIKPVFCEIDRDTYCIDPRQVEQHITERTSAIMGVHVYGNTCAVDQLSQIAERHDLALIFDAAHAFGCAHKGRMVANFGVCEVFSFHATKVFNTIEGGAVTTNDDALAAKIRMMRNFGFPGDGSEQVACVGTNAKMNEFSAAMGLANLESLPDFLQINRENYSCYRRHLADIPGISLLAFNEQESNNYQYVIISVDKEAYGHDREDLLKHLHKQDIFARRYFYPGCHRAEPYLNRYTDINSALPITDEVSESVLALPTGTQMGQREAEMISQLIREFHHA